MLSTRFCRCSNFQEAKKQQLTEGAEIVSKKNFLSNKQCKRLRSDNQFDFKVTVNKNLNIDVYSKKDVETCESKTDANTNNLFLKKAKDNKQNIEIE